MKLQTVALAALLAVSLTDHLAIAQPPAFALGQPLADDKLESGTVSVRVIAGDPNVAVAGADVTLLVAGTPRTARANAEGRAIFTGLTAGTSVQARIKDAEGKDITSSAFPVPSSGGMRVMLSTKPFGGGASNMGGGQSAGGGHTTATGMPDAKQMAGQPRADKDTPPGTYVVRVTYDNLESKGGRLFDANPPVGETVTLVGYAADDSVTVERAKADPKGYATFRNLDMSGGTAYFALALLPRDTGVDRMFAVPAQPDGQAGTLAVLTGEKRDSKLPNFDSHATQHSIATPPGKVRITLEGIPAPSTVVRLIDPEKKQIVAQATAGVMQGDPTTLQGGSQFAAKADVPPNTLDVNVVGGAGAARAPMPDVEIRVVNVDAKTLDGPATKTGPDGTVRITTPPVTDGKQLRVVFRVLGKDFVSEPFDVTKSGGKMEIRAQWAAEGRPQVLFDYQHTPGQVLYAEATTPPGSRLEGTFRSMPFQPVAQSGTHVGIIIYPRIMFRFNMRAMIEDQLLAVQGRFTVENNSWIPYRATPDGMTIPLPKYHKGAVVAEMNQNDVAVVPQSGFRILRPLPAGSGTSFIGGFSMPVDDGDVSWSLDLPDGTFGSDIHIRESPGMTVQLPTGTRGQVKDGKDGVKYFMVEQITIGRGKAMTLTIRGLPSPPAWRVWAPRAVGIVVVMLILAGLIFALFSKRSASAEMLARRATLLDELVQLERSGGSPKRKEQLIAELEKLWAA